VSAGGLIPVAGWTPTVLDRLDRRLNARDGAPVEVALSGGGDSVALLRLAHAWAGRAGRPLVAVTIDHGLQPESAAWARFAAERAARLGVAHRTLAWTGDKPTSGVPAAARAARHALLATAARKAGARVILMGHTADDALEALEMRRLGTTTPTPAAWAPSPAWPEGRGVFLLRPLLRVRRAELRAWLSLLGESWIEDPANEDPRYNRAAARRRLAGTEAEAPSPRCDRAVSLEGIDEGLGGELTAPRAALIAGPGARRRLGAMILCAAGHDRPARRDALERLMQRLEGPGDLIATLAGARLEARGERVMVCREAGERARGERARGERARGARGRALAERALPPGETVFDGRFLMRTAGPGFRVAALGGLAQRLPAAERRRLRAIPAGARGALPAALWTGRSGAETLSCPILALDGPVAARPLGLGRLRAALGVYTDEMALWRVAEVDPGA